MPTNPALKYKEKLKENAKMSYDTYIADNDNLGEVKYRDKVREINTDKKISDTNYGSLSDSLATAGLSGSGYEDYLKTQTEKTYLKQLNAAIGDLKRDEYKNTSGYQKYLSSFASLQSKISESVIDSIAESGSFDFDAAYKKALDAGISEDLAFHTAARGTALARKAAVENAITFAKLNGLSPLRAKKYAEGLGLEDIYAEEVYDAISTFNMFEKDYFASMTSDGYYEYIMSQSKNN